MIRTSGPENLPSWPPRTSYASANDVRECRRIHRQFGTTYYFASRSFARRTRDRVDALYAFVRVADEMVDGKALQTRAERQAALRAYRDEFLAGLLGDRPDRPELRAFCDLVAEISISEEEPLRFLAAMESDLTVGRYETYEDLREYMRGSAAAVGIMMCCVLETSQSEKLKQSAVRLGEAMQLTNFLRDVAEDAARGRVYIPREDLSAFGMSCDDILEAKIDRRFKDLMRFEIDRARKLYKESDEGILSLPPRARRSVYVARVLYSRILDRIEAQDYDVFSKRARTSKFEKLAVAASAFLRSPR